MKGVSKTVVEKVFKEIHMADPELVPIKTTKSAYKKIGVTDVFMNSVVVKRHFCTDTFNKHGSFRCGIMQPLGHEGDCVACKKPCGVWCGNKWSATDTDWYGKLGPQLSGHIVHGNLLQDLLDFRFENGDIFHSPEDRDFVIKTVEGGIIARQDCARSPEKFTFDYKIKDDEECYLNAYDIEETPGHLLAEWVPAQRATLLFTFPDGDDGKLLAVVELPDGQKRQVPYECLEKIGGRFHVNYFIMKDGKDVFDMSLCYSNENTIMAFTNVKHPRRYLTLLGVIGGGKKKKNQREHCVFLEQQQVAMAEEGELVVGRFTVIDPLTGLAHTVHNPTIFANKIFEEPDQCQWDFDAHTMGGRNPNCLATLLQNCSGWSLTNRTVHMVLDNPDVKMRSEASCKRLFKDAEALRGERGWDALAKATGAKGQTLAEIGSSVHGLKPRSDQGVWRRFAHEAMHSDGIFDTNLRAAVVSLVGKDKRKNLCMKQQLLVQPVGTKPLYRYVQYKDKKGYTAHFAGEKLMSKRHWRQHRMIYDLIPLAEGDDELIMFIETWYLHAQLEHADISMNMLGGWMTIAKSMMAQFEHICISRGRFDLLKTCSISYVIQVHLSYDTLIVICPT